MPNAVNIQLSNDEIDEIKNAAPSNPLFPNSFLFAGRKHNTKLAAVDKIDYRMCDLNQRSVKAAATCREIIATQLGYVRSTVSDWGVI
jgi:hypothetical protein